jgi:hypothetical protein
MLNEQFSASKKAKNERRDSGASASSSRGGSGGTTTDLSFAMKTEPRGAGTGAASGTFTRAFDDSEDDPLLEAMARERQAAVTREEAREAREAERHLFLMQQFAAAARGPAPLVPTGPAPLVPTAPLVGNTPVFAHLICLSNQDLVAMAKGLGPGYGTVPHALRVGFFEGADFADGIKIALDLFALMADDDRPDPLHASRFVRFLGNWRDVSDDVSD